MPIWEIRNSMFFSCKLPQYRKRVVSSSDNFLVFEANVEESSLVVKKYAQYVYKQIAELEGKVKFAIFM